jgi:hypothetical protein
MSAWLVWLTDILGLANMFDILGVDNSCEYVEV